MPQAHFTPHAAPARPCWHCAHFLALDAASGTARCAHAACPRVRAQPAFGCSHFLRETGADDEPARVPPAAGGASGPAHPGPTVARG